jgi:hypothetical protein
VSTLHGPIAELIEAQADHSSDDDYTIVDSEHGGEDDLTQAVEKGSRCDSKELYFVPREDDPTRFNLVEEKPASFSDDEPGKTKKAREAYAVNVLYRFDEDKDEWNVSELRVNSVKLHTALERILEGYPGLTQHELKSFAPPFLPFVHRWQDMLAYTETLKKDSDTYEHMQVLCNVLKPLLKKSFDTIDEIRKTGHVAFLDLPLVYIPETVVLKHETRAAGIFRSCRYTKGGTHASRWDVAIDVVDWDGRRCGLYSATWDVFQYVGLRALTSLEVSPLSGLASEAEIREELVQRGRIYERLRGQYFMAFTDKPKDRLNERVMVDARAFYKHELPQGPVYASLKESGRLTWAQAMNRYASSMVPAAYGAPVELDVSPMTDEQCLLAQPTVCCFTIEKKGWEFLDINKLHEISFAEQAFERLVLAQDEKDLLLALVDRDQFGEVKPFEDFIEGKGQGMIMLLCGPPGVGKTLTAESVAEHLRRPLYKLGASDLGIDARTVETNLGKALRLCAQFGAVLLIDEADVFMEARSTNNLQRNELVSVFLRLLEYYSGLMILTTNRMKSIDTAFESRVDITLSYENLTEADRAKVWRNFLSTLDANVVDVGEADVTELAKWNFNGRQIKSAIKTATILAAKKRERLNARHLDVVLNLRNKALGMMTCADTVGGPVAERVGWMTAGESHDVHDVDDDPYS